LRRKGRKEFNHLAADADHLPQCDQIVDLRGRPGGAMEEYGLERLLDGLLAIEDRDVVIARGMGPARNAEIPLGLLPPEAGFWTKHRPARGRARIRF